MSYMRHMTKQAIYLGPRLFLTGIALFSMLLVLCGNFQLFEPLLSPVLGIVRGRPRAVSASVTIGPYPHRAELEELKKEGYVAVLSLLNTRLPPEKVLNDLEATNASRAGMKFYHVSFDYLRLEGAQNRAHIDEVIKILKNIAGRKVYIHCYLGRHRVELVRRLLTEKHAL